MSRSRRALGGGAASILQYAVTLALQLLLAPAVIRYAGREALGAYAVLMQAVGYLGLLDVGFSVAFNRFLSRATADADGGRRFSAILSSGGVFLWVANVLSGALLVGAAACLGSLMPLPDRVLVDGRNGLLLLATWTALRTPFVIRASALVARQDLAFRHVAAMVAAVVRLVISLVAVVNGAGLFGMMAAIVAAEAVDGLLCWARWNVVGFGRSAAVEPWSREILREMLAFGAQALLINVAVRLVFSSDTLIVGGIRGPVEASTFYTTQAAAILGWTLVWRITDSAGPGVNQLAAVGDAESMRSAYLRLHRYALLLGLPLCAGLLVLNDGFVRLWVGDGQFGGHVMNAAIAMFAVATITSHLDSMFRLATGEIGQLSRMAILEGTVHAAGAIVLASLLGGTGVAIAALVPHLGMTAYLNASCRRAFGVSIAGFLREAVLPAGAVSLVSAAWLVIAERVAAPVSWVPFTAVVASTLMVHAVLIAAFGLHARERALLGSLWRSVRACAGGAKT